MTIPFGPYIPFIFLIGYFPDILKTTKIKPYLKDTFSLLWNVISCTQNIENISFP